MRMRVEENSEAVMQSKQESSSGVLQITPLERQALQLLANGDAPHDVAAGLGVSVPEGEALLRKLFAAMDAGTPAEAVVSARRRGLLTAEPTSPMPHQREETVHDQIEYVSALRRHLQGGADIL
jgi:DNA-binding CsgD family transcriptional regulator